MLSHYIKMAARQLLKYKFQTIVSMLCMGIGLTFNGYIRIFLDANFSGPRNELTIYINDALLTATEYKQIKEKEIDGIENFRAISAIQHHGNAFTNKKPETLYDVSIKGITSVYFRQAMQSKKLLENFMISEGRDSIGENEVIVSHGFASRVFGKVSAIGESITLLGDSTHDVNDYLGRTYRITGILDTGSDMTSFIYAPLLYNNDAVHIKANMAAGYTVKELRQKIENAGIKKASDGAPLDINLDTPNIMSKEEILSYTIITIFSWLIFIIGFITFMKFMIQMFYARQRELALRKSLGSSNMGLYMLLACEVITMLICAFAVSCVTSECSLSYLTYMNIIPRNILRLSYLLYAQYQATIIALATALVVILFPIMKLRRNNMKEAMIRSHKGKKARNTMLALQFAISIIFFALLGLSLLITNISTGWLPEKLTEKEQKNIICVNKTKRNWNEIRTQIENLSFIEEYAYCNSENRSSATFSYHACMVGNDTVYSTILAHGDPVYLKLFNIKMKGKIVIPDEGNYVYVDKILYERLRQNPDFDGTVSLKINDFKKYQIAGIMEDNLFPEKIVAYVDYVGERPICGYMFLVDNYYDTFYYSIKDGYTADEATDVIRKIILEYIPEDIYAEESIHTIYEQHINSTKEAYAISSLMAIMVFVCLLVLVLSVYSSISLDATTRQKDIAIRKINGASGRDIIKQFIAPYLINYAITFVTIYPLMVEFLLLQINNGGENEFTTITGIIFYGIGVFITTVGLLLLTTWHKIRDIMQVNPAEVIRRE